MGCREKHTWAAILFFGRCSQTSRWSFCAKPVEDKFLASTTRQNSIHLQFFIIASVLLQNCLFLIKSSQIRHAYLCGTHILETITKYPELTHKHVQQLLTLLSNRTYIYIYISIYLHISPTDYIYIYFPFTAQRWLTFGGQLICLS